MKYEELYDSSFLSNFDEVYLNEIKNLTLEIEDEDYQIDLIKISDILGINIEYKIFSHSGMYDPSENIIYLNELEPEFRQRFTLAHELGHAVLGHNISYRTELPEYISIIEKMNETNANKFAAELLLPKRLVVLALYHAYEILEYNENEEVSENQVNEIVYVTARLLNVSEQSLRFRFNNLSLFSEAI
ncbi:ImmA/IrrE family metallo-endopeptidase [Facklamia sp. 7083-14-GEN3]|uniref:ImmA/IrrE family metallo-endopeptidase n=1 Tax=Facklamia sp. 7083-14-GEN3 TaxID=2973478 RepID=UPI00215BFE27|nr:ImmA/IrrE family metallo-endopeptidase [Facklamia sp. 7083-14-GEN3]MCR8969596.1 ImmA/IrrE family metallo-endopeptidase [Facklamia sp. 7083-14-GEN3]